MAGLTAREAEVLRLVAKGQSNKEIAAELVLSVRTVERHITNLYGKIDARGKADATAYAIHHGPRVAARLRGIRQRWRVEVAWLLGWWRPPAGSDWAHPN